MFILSFMVSCDAGLAVIVHILTVLFVIVFSLVFYEH